MVVVLTVGSLGACGTTDKPSQAATSGKAEHKVIAAVTPGAFGMVPLNVALDKGFMAARGVSVEQVQVTGPTLVSSVLGGDVNVALTAPLVVFPANVKGAGLIQVAGNVNKQDYVPILSAKVNINPNLPYPESAKALKGLRLGITGLGGATQIVFQQIMRDAGLDPAKDATFVAVGGAAPSVTAFKENQVDALMAFSPITSLLDEQKVPYTPLVKLNQGEGPSYLTDYVTAGYYSSGKWLDKNKEAALAFCSALKDADDWMHEPANLDELVSIVTKKLQMKESMVRSALAISLGSFSARISETGYTSSLDLAKRAGIPVPDGTFADAVFEPCMKAVNK
jgi:NitT/TauT family transport system substrate-binding protein